MPRCLGTHVLGSFFLSALLPPRDPDEPSFYDILGLEPSATDEELRKSYRKLSLKLHPDKIAQRGGNKEEAAAKYEKIQEAYHVLIDEKKRLKYDALGTPTRYRFVERGGFADPQSIYENLVGASFQDKSRLVWLFFLAILILLTQPILVAAKIEQTLREVGPLEMSSWFAILIPYWVGGALFIILTFVATIFVPAQDRVGICLVGLEQILWYTSIIFLCFKWDGTWDESVPYEKALGPLYAAIVVRWSRSFFTIQKVGKDVNRMVTSDYIEKECLKGRSMEDLPQEEQEELMKAFIVVSVDPEFVPSAEDLTDEELEEERVASSAEFEAATELYGKSFYALASSLFFGSIFLILLTLKLDDRLGSGANWWAVFSPFWIERGGRLLLSLYKFLCGGISGDEIVVYGGEDFPVAFEVDGTNENESNDKKVEETATEEEPNDENATKVSPAGDEGVQIVDGGKSDNTTSERSAGDKTKPVSPIGTDSNDVGDNDDEEIHLDQDTYDAFQSAYQEAEKTTQQERAQSCTESCVLIFQIVIVSLVVAKIQKNYDSVDPNDVGFNVFWILFPFFLIFGLTLCCCAILIFGSAPELPEGELDEVGNDLENPAVPAPPATPTQEEVAMVETSASPEREIEESKPEEPDLPNVPSDSNMDDLD